MLPLTSSASTTAIGKTAIDAAGDGRNGHVGAVDLRVDVLLREARDGTAVAIEHRHDGLAMGPVLRREAINGHGELTGLRVHARCEQQPDYRRER